MKKSYLLAGLALLAASPGFAQVKIGAAGAPDGSAMLEVTAGASSNKGLLLPRMTTAQRDAITTPATGLTIYNTTTNQAQVNTGTPAAPAWTVATAATGWATNGNTGTTPATNFIGTTDNQPLAIRTNNTEKVRVTETGNVGIGTNTPGVKLQVVDTGDAAILVGNAAGSRGHIQLGNDNHGMMRDLTTSGGLANDVALFTSTGNAAGSSLYLVSNPTSTGSDSLPLNQFVLKNTGNIGIGTNAPLVKLHVVDTGNATILIGNADGGRGHIQLGNDNHGLIRNLTSSGGLANDVALFTSTGGGAAAEGSLYLVSNPGSYGSDSLDLTQFVLKNTGNVGIGVNNPKVKLQVQGGLLLRNDVNIAHGNGAFITWSTVRSGVGETEFVNYRGTGSGGFRFYDVDPGNSVDTAVYNTNDIAFIDVAGAYHVLSDMRVKTDVNGISNGLEKVMAMRPVSYDFHTGRTLKDGVVTFTAKDKPVKSMGFLAQELAKVVPEAVKVPKDANNELYSVTYTTLIPVLTKAIQEQQAQIEALKAKNEQLEAVNKVTVQLMERVKQMEQMMGIKEIEGTSKVAGQ